MAFNREELKKSQFGLPGKRKYPMPERKACRERKGTREAAIEEGQAFAQRRGEDRGQGQSRAQPHEEESEVEQEMTQRPATACNARLRTPSLQDGRMDGAAGRNQESE